MLRLRAPTTAPEPAHPSERRRAEELERTQAIAARYAAQADHPFEHRALDALLRAETRLMRGLAHELERRGISATGFSVLVLLSSAGGPLELRALRQRLGISKANATEVLRTLESRGFVTRIPSLRDGRALVVHITPAGSALLADIFPAHARRVRDAFMSLDEQEKRELTRLCRKLDRAA